MAESQRSIQEIENRLDALYEEQEQVPTQEKWNEVESQIQTLLWVLGRNVECPVDPSIQERS